MSEALRSCPHCGSFNVGYEPVAERIYCEDCDTSGPSFCGGDEEAAEAWNSLPRHLRWTTDTPTEPGWYWNRVAGKESLPMRLYYDSDGEYCYQVAGLPDDCWLVSDLADEVGCEWAGPISEPTEPKEK